MTNYHIKSVEYHPAELGSIPRCMMDKDTAMRCIHPSIGSFLLTRVVDSRVTHMFLDFFCGDHYPTPDNLEQWRQTNGVLSRRSN